MPSQEDHQPILRAREEAEPDNRERRGGEGGDGEHWSVGNCEKQNINIAQKFYWTLTQQMIQIQMTVVWSWINNFYLFEIISCISSHKGTRI